MRWSKFNFVSFGVFEFRTTQLSPQTAVVAGILFGDDFVGAFDCAWGSCDDEFWDKDLHFRFGFKLWPYPYQRSRHPSDFLYVFFRRFLGFKCQIAQEWCRFDLFFFDDATCRAFQFAFFKDDCAFAFSSIFPSFALASEDSTFSQFDGFARHCYFYFAHRQFEFLRAGGFGGEADRFNIQFSQQFPFSSPFF